MTRLPRSHYGGRDPGMYARSIDDGKFVVHLRICGRLKLANVCVIQDLSGSIADMRPRETVFLTVKGIWS
jgi:hypothetical protein